MIGLSFGDSSSSSLLESKKDVRAMRCIILGSIVFMYYTTGSASLQYILKNNMNFP